MTPQDDLDRTLAGWFGTETAAAPPPEPLAQVLATTRRLRPRRPLIAGIGSAWPGGHGRPHSARPAAVRSVVPVAIWMALAALLLALVGASLLAGGHPPIPALVVATSRPNPSPTSSLLTRESTPPAPFIAARNGLIAYTVGDDLFAGDPATGSSHKIATGVGQDALFSRDGTLIATVRLVKVGDGMCSGPSPAGLYAPESLPAAVCTSRLVVTTIAGRSSVMPDALPYPATTLDWSADGRWILVQTGYRDVTNTLWAVAADGSGAHRIDTGPYAPAVFGPPDARTVWYVGSSGTDGASVGLVTADLQGGTRSQIASAPAVDGKTFALSPDGTRVAVSLGRTIGILHADGTPEHTIPLGTSVTAVTRLAFSPDGRQLLVEQDSGGIAWNVIVAVDGTTTNSTIFGNQAGAQRHRCGWSPDGGSLLCQDDAGTYWIVDPTGGPDRQLSWGDPGFDYLLSWQRLAP